MRKTVCLLLVLIIMLNFSIVYGENLGLSAESCILMDSNTGRILYEKNSHNKMPMASITKIMTALIALEEGSLKDIITINAQSAGVEGSSIYLRENEEVTLEDLLYGLMLRSGNDSAVAIALHIGDTVEGFVELMNKKAKKIGALNTNFVNPNGLHNDDHYSTAYDMALITREAFLYNEFEKIVGTKTYVSSRNENNYYQNKNETLWRYEGGDGVKTGYTTKSGRCLVSSAKRSEMRLISVVIRANDWFNDNYKLLNYGFDNFKPYIIYDENQFIKKIKVDDANKDYIDLVTRQDLFYPLNEYEVKKVKINIVTPDKVRAPINKGDTIGDIYVYLDNKLINKDKLVAKASIERLNILEKLIKKFTNK